MAKSVGFIGFGNMGAAIAHCLYHAQQDVAIIAVEPHPDRQDWIHANAPYVQLMALADMLQNCKYVFLAVKPNMIQELSAELKPLLRPHHVLISMLAGVSVATCEELLSRHKLVRIMPNTPAKVGRAFTGVCFSSGLSDDETSTTLLLCKTFGECLICTENDLNTITAVSGSGPAFFYRMAQACIDFGVAKGLNETNATQAVIQTMLGAAHMLIDDPNPTDQIRRVASPNGTTEAGLNAMTAHDFDAVVAKTLESALNRAIALSKEIA